MTVRVFLFLRDSHVAEFAELQLTGKPAPDALAAVAHHLTLCPECHEEYEKLKKAIIELQAV